MITQTTPYGFGVTLALPYEAAVEQTKAALTQEGFGVLTEIDVAATMKKKIGVDMQPYRILGACNPQMAYHTISG